jgi:hypothetical protein
MRVIIKTNGVTAYGIYKALREAPSNGLTTREIAVAANFDASPDSLSEIDCELESSNHASNTTNGNKAWAKLDQVA